MAESNTNAANLFGESDSSDESVGAPPAPAAAENVEANRTKIADSDDNDDGAPPPSGGVSVQTNKEGRADDADKPTDEPAATKDSDEKVKNPPPSSSASNANKNSNLFGDDDSSSDDEFDGNDDGIVGRSGGANSAVNIAAASGKTVAKKPMTMNQTLGLDSDSDDDKGVGSGAEKKEGQEDDDDDKPVYAPPRKMELLNLATTDGNHQTKIHITKLPNLVGINTAAYNPETHNLEDEEEYYRGYVHNMIRWRYKNKPEDETELVRDENGHPIRESNTRLVKWSDGSYTLHVGQEVLEVDNLDSSVPLDEKAEGAGGGNALAGFAGINGYLYVSQKARIRPPSKRELENANKEGVEGKEKDDIMDDSSGEDAPAQPAGTVLECLGPIVSRFAPRPSSLASEAHRNLTLAVRQRNVKRARIAEIVTDFDPEKEKQARIKGKDDLAKSQARSNMGGRRSGGSSRKRGMNAGYLEDEDDYDGVNLGKLKRSTMRGNNYDSDEEMDYGEDSDEEEDEWTKNKARKPSARASSGVDNNVPTKNQTPDFGDSSSEEGEVVFGDDEDEDDAAMFKKRSGGEAKKKAVLDDDDD